MGRKLRYLGPSERAEIERLHNGGAPAAIAERVGSHVATTYKVSVHFSRTSRETMGDKLVRLIERDAVKQ